VPAPFAGPRVRLDTPRLDVGSARRERLTCVPLRASAARRQAGQSTRCMHKWERTSANIRAIMCAVLYVYVYMLVCVCARACEYMCVVTHVCACVCMYACVHCFESACAGTCYSSAAGVRDT
jgi:hypothetical protein